MKKCYLLAIVLSAMVLSFTVSCSKSEESTPTNPETPDNPINHGDQMGVYNPGKKIKKVYQEEWGENKKLLSVWNWTGNKLESIDHYDDDGIWNYKEKFSYDEKNRLTHIDYEGAPSNRYVDFEYNEDELVRVKDYSANGLQATFSFTNQNGKMTECVYRNSDFVNEFKVNWFWSSNNVEKYTGSMSTWTDMTTLLMSYDEKKNPFKGFLAPMVHFWVWSPRWEEEFLPYYMCWSENNITRLKIEEGGELDEIFRYVYDSDGFPISMDCDEWGLFYFEYE